MSREWLQKQMDTKTFAVLTFTDAMQVRIFSGFAISCWDIRSTGWMARKVIYSLSSFATIRFKSIGLNVGISILLNLII